jgi:alpha-tubulin suppressor-like RCC1 family protein
MCVLARVCARHGVSQVAVGARHAALLTRGGEVYTWGAGLGGTMGNGTSCGSNFPQQVRVCCV